MAAGVHWRRVTCGGGMRKFVSLLAGLVAAAPQLAGAASPPRVPVEALLVNPVHADPDLSDHVSQLAYDQSNGDLWVVIAEAIDGGQPKPLAKFDDPQTRLNRLEWAHDRRILFSA